MRTSVREHLRASYADLLVRTGAVDRVRSGWNNNKAVVLLYHRVLDDKAIPADIDPGIYVTRTAFERQLQYISEHHEVLSLDSLLEWLNAERTTYRPPCVLTFDDGWIDNYEVAFPLLRRYGIPATIFLITDLVGTQDMVSWPQVHEMRASAISFGSHTATHPFLTRIGDNAVREELTRSKTRMEEELGEPCRWFCYPRGQHDRRTLNIARRLYDGAVGTVNGPVTRDCDPFRIHRIGIHQDVSRTTNLFACRLASLV